MKTKPDLSFWKLWNLSFGFFGVQIAYALQSANISRIFTTIGADPHDLSYFWILPPLMGIVVQPIIGSASDRTWTKLGRRLPYLILGALIAVIVMCLLPNAGSFGLSISSAIIFGLLMLMLLDTSINMAMQPFKMLVGDQVNEKQKGLAYSIQSFLCNAGSVVGYVAPFILALFVSKTAPTGEVPPTVTFSFYIGAAILILCVIYTMFKVKEMPPAEYNYYNGTNEESKEEEKTNMLKLLVKAPKVFWTVGLVQFFCWAAFLYMWTYTTNAVAENSFECPKASYVSGVTVDGNSHEAKFVLSGNTMVVEKGRLTYSGITTDNNGVKTFTAANTIVLGNDTVMNNNRLVYVNGISKYSDTDIIAKAGSTLNIDGKETVLSGDAKLTSFLSQIKNNDNLTFATIAVKEKGSDKYTVEESNDVKVSNAETIAPVSSIRLNAESTQFQDAGDWIGILFAVQALGSVAWAVFIPMFKNRKFAYSLSLLIGGLGFISIYFITNQYLLILSFILIGTAWAAMLALPFTILTNSLSGNHIGTYLGLFNGTICLPQIVAAIVGGSILSLFTVPEGGVPPTINMLVVAGALLIVASLTVWIIKETSGEKAIQEKSKNK